MSASLMAICAPDAAAQSPRLDLAACRARALEAAPDLASATADLEAAHLGVGIAGAALLPTLQAEGGYLRSSVNHLGIPDFAANNGENEYTARGVVSQPLYSGGSLAAGRAKARSEEVGAEHSLALTRATVLLATDRAYFAALAAAEGEIIAKGQLVVNDELLRAGQVHLANGEVPALDVGKFELEVANATTVLHAAQGAVEIARTDLASLIRLPPDGFDLEPLPVDDSAPALLGSLDEMVTKAFSDRPDLKRLAADVQAQEAAVGIAHGARLPQIRAEAAGGYDSLTLPDRRNVGWDAGVALSLPVWDWNALANRERVARLQVEKARDRLEAARRAVEGEVRRRYIEASVGRQQLHTLATAEALARKNADAARRGYEIGLVSSLDLITAERQAVATASEHTRAAYDYRVSLSQLDFARGQLR